MRALIWLLCWLPSLALAQLPTLTAAWRVGASGYEQGFEVSVDIPGHVVVVGYFEATVDFDPGAATQNRTSAGMHDIFVAKYTTAGAFEWAFRIGGVGYDQATGVDVDASGNVFVSGYFTGSVDFDPGAGTTSLNAGSADDAFLAKYSPTGALLWAIKIGASGYDMSNNCSTDANGDVYITGHFVGTVDFNPSASTANLTSAGSMDMYLAKYSSAGAYLWAIRVGASGFNDDSGYDIATFGSSDVYVTGLFSGTVDFDPGAGTVSRVGAGGNDIFLLKLNSAGVFQWVYTGGNADTDESTGVDVDALGNVYLAGSFGMTVDFDPGAGVANLTSAGVGDLFVAKYSAAGALTWVRQIGGVNNQHSWGMAVSPDGNTFFTGFHQGTADFDPTASVYNVASAGSFDSYLASLDANGNFRFAFPIGAANLDVGYGVDVNDACEVAITGYFDGTADLDPQVTQANLTSTGGFDAYVAVYGACGPLAHQVITLQAMPRADGVVALAWESSLDGDWRYVVERSPDLQAWTEVAASAGAVGMATDPSPSAGRSWYRIAAQAVTGATAYSNVCGIDFSRESASLYPTMAYDWVQVDLPLAWIGYDMQLYDVHGQRLWAGKVTDAGMRLPITHLAAGTYFLRIAYAGQTLRFWKE
jgi:hypothetical protein